MAFKLQDCIVANFFTKFKAAPCHRLRDVPHMGQAEGKEGQMLLTVKGYTSVPNGNSGLRFDCGQQSHWKKISIRENRQHVECFSK